MKVIVTEQQLRRLFSTIIEQEQPLATTDDSSDGIGDETPSVTTNASGEPETITTGEFTGDAPTGDEGGDDLSLGGDLGGGGAGPSNAFDASVQNAASNAKMSKWDSGVSHGKANPLQSNPPWESGIGRGVANQTGNTKWSDIVGGPVRGKANKLT